MPCNQRRSIGKGYLSHNQKWILDRGVLFLTGNVENSSQQGIIISSEINAVGQTSELGVAEIGSVEDGEGVEAYDQWHDTEIQFSKHCGLFGGS